MYKVPRIRKTTIVVKNKEIGQRLETKIKRLIENNEHLEEAPLIYTEKKEGVKAGHNVRTDKWEIAVEAMDKIHKYRNAQGENKRGKLVEMKDQTTEKNETNTSSDA